MHAHPTLSEAVRRAKASLRPSRPEGILIDPHASIEEVHEILERLEAELSRQSAVVDPARNIYRDLGHLQARLKPLAYVQ